MKRITLLLLFPLLAFTSCLKEELAFTVDAAPVLGLIQATTAPEGMVAYEGTFYELDKSGILDADVGIDSIPVAGLELKVFSQNADLLQTIVTDAAGKTTLMVAADALTGVTRLEWTGTYDGRNFRVLKGL